MRFKFKQINDLNHWFRIDSYYNNKYLVYEKTETGKFKQCDILSLEDCLVKYDEFKVYQERPEAKFIALYQDYLNGKSIPRMSSTELIELILGAYLLKISEQAVYLHLVDRVLPRLEQFVNILESNKFLEYPYEPQHDFTYKNGMLEYFRVAIKNAFILYNTQEYIYSFSLPTAIFTLFLSEVGKLGAFEEYPKWSKDEYNEWVSNTAYKYKEIPSYKMGAGVNAVFISMKFFNLTVEEATAIRWKLHNPAPNDNENVQFYSARKLPLVSFLRITHSMTLESR